MYVCDFCSWKGEVTKKLPTFVDNHGQRITPLRCPTCNKTVKEQIDFKCQDENCCLSDPKVGCHKPCARRPRCPKCKELMTRTHQREDFNLHTWTCFSEKCW